MRRLKGASPVIHRLPRFLNWKRGEACDRLRSYAGLVRIDGQDELTEQYATVIKATQSARANRLN
ncbi:MAG: hypothetical protein OXE76_09175, partial [Alphaproteobacteria bacterium]|nr:hypothetical protein [Alphaproteobacteria bacterium]